jgi:hypothetical protein
VSKLTDAVRAQTSDHPDKAAAALAAMYAEALDATPVHERTETLKDLGPGLLRVLESLALTPKARAAGGPNSAPVPPTPAAPSRLEALRGEYGPGQHGTASVDAAAS